MTPSKYLLAISLWLTTLGVAPAQEITLPKETAQYTPSELPGYALVQSNCLICHSAHYVLYQPPSSSREYWDKTVKKMKHPFGAFFPDEDIAPMVDYLVKTYGAERPDPATQGVWPKTQSHP
jgi:sulfite dehydrogenase